MFKTGIVELFRERNLYEQTTRASEFTWVFLFVNPRSLCCYFARNIFESKVPSCFWKLLKSPRMILTRAISQRKHALR